jgi:hypothetical protein
MPGAREAPAPTLRIAERDPCRDSGWERFISSHPDALIYHHPAWMRVLLSEYPRPSIGLVCEEPDGTVRGVLPLIKTRGMPLRRGHLSRGRLSSLPRTPLGGPLALDPDAAGMLVGAAVERRDPNSLLELKFPSGESLPPVPDGAVTSQWRSTYRIRLPERPEDLRFGNARNHSRIAWSCRRAAKLGVRLREGDSLADLRAWYPLHCESLRAHMVPPRPLRFFEAAWRELRPDGYMRLLLAEERAGGRSELVAGSIFLSYGQTAFYAFDGRSRAKAHLRASDLIQNEAIRSACAAGLRWFDLGEVAHGETGLAAFKTKWGAKPVDLYRMYFPAPSDLESGAQSDGRVHKLALTAWSHLPLTVTAKLGDLVYAYL